MTTAATQGWRRWFASTGAPPMWRPVLYAVAGLVVGGVLGAVLTPQKGPTLFGGLEQVTHGNRLAGQFT